MKKPKSQSRFIVVWLRLFLGVTQLLLVGMSIGALLTVGLDTIAWIFIIGATVATIISRLLYHGRTSSGRDNANY